MAIIDCPVCGKKFKDISIENCPECGFAIKEFYDDLDESERAAERIHELALSNPDLMEYFGVESNRETTKLEKQRQLDLLTEAYAKNPDHKLERFIEELAGSIEEQ